jgi:hypothetical protein
MSAKAAKVSIRSRERDAILQSLAAGVVPRLGLQHIQVGRVEEVRALIRDLERIADGGSGVRFVIGEYGSGKTFFLQLIRSIALQKSLLAAHADLTPDRRLHATGGQGRNLYAELMRNLSTRTKPDGGALPSVVERFVSSALQEARKTEGAVTEIIHSRLQSLSEMVGGYDFATVVDCYWRGHESGNEQLQSDAVRWLRAEYSTKTDARAALGVRSIVDDANFYDRLKLMARFVRLAGYSGLMVALDEMVNLFKLANTKARNSNYEQILRVVNDCLQGSAEGLGFVFGGTPEFLMDARRGLYSYEALHSRLEENAFAASAGVVDYNAPVLRLENLSPEDLFVVLQRIRHVFASGDTERYLVPDEALHAFMAHCFKKVGEAYFRTPRSTIKRFVGLLSVLEQEPALDWRKLVDAAELETDTDPSTTIQDIVDSDDGELANFRL